LSSTVLSAQSLRNSQAAADDATRKLEEAISGNISGYASSRQNTPVNAAVPQPPVQITRGGARPAWVTDPYAVYSRGRYIAAVSFASNRAEAEKKAFAALVAFFGQSVRTSLEVASIYSEAVTNGVISVSENTRVRDIIVTAASLDKLVGAEIGYIWDDGRGIVNALAYVEKERTVVIYNELIRLNQKNINELVTMTTSEKNTFDGYARYKLASMIAKINSDYAGIVTLAGGASINFTSANTLILESQNIIKSISVSINVTGDLNNRVRDAFAGVLSGEGLRTQGRNNPYTLDINVNMNETVFPNSDYIHCRFTVNANLVERATGAVLLPFSITEREGHASYEQAQARAYLLIERFVAERYPVVFKEYLASLMPE